MKAATWTFGLWALLLPISAGIVITQINSIAASQVKIAAEFVAYREMMERRITILEERQLAIVRQQNEINEDHRQNRNHYGQGSQRN